MPAELGRLFAQANWRKSSVTGCSPVGTVCGGSKVPGVWPIGKKRARRRVCFVGVDRKAVEAASARVRHMIGAPADRTLAPAVVQIEDQRRVDWNGRMQRRATVARHETARRQQIRLAGRSPAMALRARCTRAHAGRRSHRRSSPAAARPSGRHSAPFRRPRHLRPARARARAPRAAPSRSRDTRPGPMNGKRNS